MNIGIVTTWFESGAGYVSRQYAQAFSFAGHRVHIYARRGYRTQRFYEEEVDTITWAKETRFPKGSQFELNHFYNWIVNKNIKIILFNEQTWFKPVQIAKSTGVYTISYIDYYTRENLKQFEIYDMLFCNTKRHYEAFIWHKNAKYIPWGTDVKLFRMNEKRIGEKGELVFYHSCGGNPERKGTDLLIRAFSQIDRNCSLIIHTQTNLLKKLKGLSDLIRKLVGSGRLTVIQGTVTAPGLYLLGDIYVYPSRLEGIGLSIVEALSSGLPVITTNNPPMNEFVTNTFGSLVDVEYFKLREDAYYWEQSIVSINDLKAKMEMWINKKDEIDFIRESTRESVVRELNWEDRYKMISDILEANVKNRKLDSNLNIDKNRLTFFMLNKLYSSYRMFKNIRIGKTRSPNNSIKIYGVLYDQINALLNQQLS